MEGWRRRRVRRRIPRHVGVEARVDAGRRRLDVDRFAEAVDARLVVLALHVEAAGVEADGKVERGVGNEAEASVDDEAVADVLPVLDAPIVRGRVDGADHGDVHLRVVARGARDDDERADVVVRRPRRARRRLDLGAGRRDPRLRQASRRRAAREVGGDAHGDLGRIPARRREQRDGKSEPRKDTEQAHGDPS